METQLFQDRFGTMFYDDARNVLELRWFPTGYFDSRDQINHWFSQ